MTDDDRSERWLTHARRELKRRLDTQLDDFNQCLGHNTDNEVLVGAGLAMGSIHEMQAQGLLTAEETRDYQAKVRSVFAERLPEYLPHFDQLLMWEPSDHD